jgi:hypothetical protein
MAGHHLDVAEQPARPLLDRRRERLHLAGFGTERDHTILGDAELAAEPAAPANMLGDPSEISFPSLCPTSLNPDQVQRCR